VQDGLDGRSTGDVDDFIDGSLSGLDQAHNGQQELSLLLEEFAQGPAVLGAKTSPNSNYYAERAARVAVFPASLSPDCLTNRAALADAGRAEDHE
jgi:hypothetical protein